MRQYHNIKAEIDTKMQEVRESGQYGVGPMRKKFEAERALFHGTRYAIAVGKGEGRVVSGVSGLGNRRGRRVHYHREYVPCHCGGQLTRAAVVFVDSDPGTELHRSKQD